MDPSNDGQYLTSDYLEPRSVSVPIPGPSENGWHGRISSFWCNIVTTLRSSGRSKRKRQVLERTKAGQVDNASSSLCHAEKSSARTWKYVGTFGKMNFKRHNYYNLIEDLTFRGLTNNAETSNDCGTFGPLRTPKKKRFGLCSVTERNVNCKQEIHRTYLLDNYKYLQVLTVLSCRIMIDNFVSNNVGRKMVKFASSTMDRNR